MGSFEGKFLFLSVFLKFIKILIIVSIKYSIIKIIIDTVFYLATLF